MINIVLDKTTGVRTTCTCVSEKVEGKESETTFEYQGRIQDFVLGGGALVSCSTSTPINLIVFFFFFFFCRIPGVLENRRSSQVVGGAHPLHPPPRSAPGKTETQDRSFCLRRDWCRDMQWLHVYRLQTFLENSVGK